jgi:TonB family protein
VKSDSSLRSALDAAPSLTVGLPPFGGFLLIFPLRTMALLGFQFLLIKVIGDAINIYLYREPLMSLPGFFPLLLFGLTFPSGFVDASHRPDLPILTGGVIANADFPEKVLQTGSKDETGVTALMQAVQDENLQEVQLQFLKGANANAKDAFGWTALMYAVRYLHMGNIVTLLEHGADVQAKDNRGRSVLMWAALTGKADLIKLLLAKGADVNAADHSGATAFSFAVARGHNKVAALIKAGGGNGPVIAKSSVPEQIAPVDELPKVLKFVYPEFPKEASGQNIQGKVHLHVLVKKDGTIAEIKVARGMSYGLTESAIAAASKLVVKPAINNGQAVDFWTPVQVEFSRK